MTSLVLFFINLICGAFGLQFAQDALLLFFAVLVEVAIELLIGCAIVVIKTMKDSK